MAHLYMQSQPHVGAAGPVPQLYLYSLTRQAAGYSSSWRDRRTLWVSVR